MNGYLAHTNTKSVQSRPGSKAILFLFVVLLFTIPLLLLDTILYIRSEQSDCSRIIDDDGQWRENERQREKERPRLTSSSISKSKAPKIQRSMHSYFDIYFANGQQREYNGHSFCEKVLLHMHMLTLNCSKEYDQASKF